MASKTNPFADLGAEPIEAEEDFSDLGAVAVLEEEPAPEADFADLGAVPVEEPQEKRGFAPMDFFKNVGAWLHNIKQRQEEQAAIQAQEAQAQQQVIQEQDADPATWSSTRFKKEAPKPNTIEEKAVYDAIIKQKTEREKAITAQITGEGVTAPSERADREVEIRQTPAKRKGFEGLVDSLKKFYRPGDTSPPEVARAQLVRELSQEFDLDPSYVEGNFDALARKKAESTGVYTQPTNEEVLNAVMLGTLPMAAAISGPLAIAKGLIGYTATKEVSERAILPAARAVGQALAQEPVQYEVTKLREVLPDVGPLHDVADLAEFVIYGITAHKAGKFLQEPKVAAELAGMRFRILKALGVKQPTELVPLSDAQIKEAFGDQAWKYLSKEGIEQFKTEELAKRGAPVQAEKPVEVRIEGPAAEAVVPVAPEVVKELGAEPVAPIIPKGKKLRTFEPDDQTAITGVINDISGMEALGRKRIVDPDLPVGEDVRYITTGYVPEYLKNIGVTKAKDIPILQKAAKNEPLTDLQHERVVELIGRWYTEQEKIYGKSIEELQAELSKSEAKEASDIANEIEPPPAEEGGILKEAPGESKGVGDFPFGENAPKVEGAGEKVKVFQGKGKTPKEIYGEEAVKEGRAIPIAGPGEYYAFSKEDATFYGQVKELEIELKNPLIIDSDKKWFDLLKVADAMHLHSASREFYTDKPGIAPATQRLKKYIQDEGYDSLVIRGTEDNKRLRESFGHDTVVSYGVAPKIERVAGGGKQVVSRELEGEATLPPTGLKPSVPQEERPLAELKAGIQKKEPELFAKGGGVSGFPQRDITIDATTEDFELNPTKMIGLKRAIAIRDEATGKIYSVPFGRDRAEYEGLDVYNHSDFALALYRRNKIKGLMADFQYTPGFISKENVFVVQGVPETFMEPEPDSGGVSGFPSKPTDPPPVPEDRIFTPWDMPMRLERPSGHQASTNAPEIIDALADALREFGAKDPIRVGRFRHKAMGVHYTKSQVIRIKTANDILTAAHEVGHALEQGVFGFPRRRKVVPGLGSKPEKELLKLGKILYGPRVPSGGYIREGFAEFTRMWVSDRRQAKIQAPLFYEYFEKTFLPKHPEGAKALDHVQELFHRWQSQGAAGRAKASVLRRDALAEKAKSLAVSLKKATSYETHIDMLQPLKKLTDEAQEKLGRELLPEEDPFFTAKALRLTHDARVRTMVERNMIDVAGNPVGGPLHDITALVKDRRDDFTIYLWAKRAEALWLDPKRGKARNPGLSLKDAEQIIKELETDKFKLAAQKVYDWNDGVLNYAAQASPTFAQAVEKIRERDPGYYIPLQREFRELDSIAGRAAGRARAQTGNITARLKGSGRRIVDPFPQMIAKARDIVKAAHNRMVIDQMVRLSKVQGMGHLVEKVNKDMVPTATKTIQELLEAIDRKAGTAFQAEVDEDLLSETITFFTPAQFPKGKDPIIPIATKGKIEWYQVDRELYDALGAMEVYRLPSVGAFPVLDWVFGKPARIFRAGTTGLRATFGLVMNPLRDIQTLYINSQVNVNPLHLFGAWMKSMVNSAFRVVGGKPDPYLDAFLRLGGEMAQPLGQDIAHTQRAARQLFEGRIVRMADPRNWLDWFRDLVQFPESASRVAELRTFANEIGWQPGQPMSLNQSLRLLQAAKEVTTDFTAAGEFGRVMNQIIPFYNASIQGPRANIRSATRSPKHTRRFILRGLALTAATIYLWNQHKDEDWYKEMEARERFGYWHFPINWPDKTLLRIPRAFEIGMIFSALPEALLDAWYKKDPQAVKDWMKNFYDLGNPLDYPVLIRELIAQAGNKDLYWETPIVPRAMEQKPAEEQFNEYTSRLAIKLGEIFNQSPRRLDHAINGIFGPAAGDVIDLLGLGPKGVDTESEAADIPVIGKLFQRGGEVGHHPKSVTLMYDALEKALQKQYSDKTPETKKERDLRLMLTDAARAVSIIQYVRSQTQETEKREKLTLEAVQIASKVVRKYHEGKVSRGEFKTLRRQKEDTREKINRAKERERQLQEQGAL